MKLTSINCPNCNGQLREESGKLICTMCGSAFAIDYDDADVEHEKLQTEAERERIRIEREKELMATKIRLEEEAQIRRAERARKQVGGSFLKFLLTPICIMVCMSIVSMIVFMVIGRRATSSYLNRSTRTTVTAPTTTKPTQPVLTKEILLSDQAFVENALATGASYTKTQHNKTMHDFDIKKEYNLAMVPSALLACDPELINVYYIQADTNYFVMFYKLTFTYDDPAVDREKTMYFACYLKGSVLNGDGSISSDYVARMDSGSGMDLNYVAYEDKDQMYREVVLGKGGTCEDLTADLVKEG